MSQLPNILVWYYNRNICSIGPAELQSSKPKPESIKTTDSGQYSFTTGTSISLSGEFFSNISFESNSNLVVPSPGPSNMSRHRRARSFDEPKPDDPVHRNRMISLPVQSHPLSSQNIAHLYSNEPMSDQQKSLVRPSLQPAQEVSYNTKTTTMCIDTSEKTLQSTPNTGTEYEHESLVLPNPLKQEVIPVITLSTYTSEKSIPHDTSTEYITEESKELIMSIVLHHSKIICDEFFISLRFCCS